MNVLRKPKAQKLKSIGTTNSTERQEKHVSYIIDTGKETRTFLSTPTSPTKHSVHVDTEDEEELMDENPMAEDDLERDDDEIRLLELQGLAAHLQSSTSTYLSDVQGPARKRKRTAAVRLTKHLLTIYLIIRYSAL